MGEVIDLEIYRKRLKRGVERGGGPGNRRSPDHDPESAKTSEKNSNPKKHELGDSNLLEPSGKTKIESNESKSD